jgi:outer membrane lipoprotein SlyB
MSRTAGGRDNARHGGETAVLKEHIMKAKHLTAALLVFTLSAGPALAETRLSSGERARVARAPRAERADLRACLIERKKGQKKGTIIGAAGAGGTAAIAGGDVGESLLGAGVGALAGNLIGKEAGTSRYCKGVLARNR